MSIAILPSLAAGWLPAVLAGFRKKHPGVELQVADVLSEPCIERVKAGEADFVLAATRADTPELQAEWFCSDDFHLVCRNDHPLARRRNLQPADLAPYPFVHLSRNSSVRQYLDAAMHDRDVKKPHENPAIGVLLCATKDDKVVEYALSRTASPALIAQYQTQLPDRASLQAKLQEFWPTAVDDSDS